MQKKIKVLYIAGSGRCGSTVLSQLLGEVEGFINLGEVRYLFNERMQKRNLPCSCGAAPERCSFWARYTPGISSKVRRWSTRNLRLLILPALMLRSRLTGKANLREFSSVVARLYSEMSADTKARVFIDASKHPAFAWAMSQVPEVDVYILHLIRDARDVVGSWSRPKGYLRAKHPLLIIRQWIFYNIFIDILFGSSEKYMPLQYDNFARDPLQCLKDVVSFMSEDADIVSSLCPDGKHRFQLTRRQHILAGNPGKMHTSGYIEVLYRKPNTNEFWCKLTEVLCRPLLLKYGFEKNK